jgi:hypothetical protein
MADLIPQEALAYLKNKSLQPAFSCKDVWHEKHAAAFTVAKAMQLDVLADLHTAVVDAMEKGQSIEAGRQGRAGFYGLAASARFPPVFPRRVALFCGMSGSAAAQNSSVISHEWFCFIFSPLLALSEEFASLFRDKLLIILISL